MTVCLFRTVDKNDNKTDKVAVFNWQGFNKAIYFLANIVFAD
jgi:hypothetical protein